MRRPTIPALFIDANILLYSGGTPHPLREPSRRILLLAAEMTDAFVTDAEVLQEILHHYLALRRWSQGHEQFDDFAELMRGRVEPIMASDVEYAASIARDGSGLSSRDLLHLAVMTRLGVERIVTADTGFENIRGLERLDPARFEEWRRSVV